MHSVQSNSTEAKLMKILQNWNDANNAKDADTLSRLYASKITYYGSNQSHKKCIKDKKRLFKKYPYFSQSIQNAAFSAIIEEEDGITDKNIKRKNSMPTYTLGAIHELKGRIEKVFHYEPPGYGEDPKNNQKLIAYILKLDTPINVVSPEGDDLGFTTKTKEVQLLAFNYLTRLEKAAKKGKVVTLSGEFFSAHTGYHIRDVLMDVKALK